MIRVLIFEDNMEYVQLMERAFKAYEGREFELVHFAELGAGLESLIKETYDAVLLDLTLVDASESITLGSMQEYGDQLPVIVLSATTHDRLERVVRDHGMDFRVKDATPWREVPEIVTAAVREFRLARQAEDIADQDPK